MPWTWSAFKNDPFQLCSKKSQTAQHPAPEKLQTTVPKIGHLPSVTLPTKAVCEVRGHDPTGVGGMFLGLLDLQVQMYSQKLQ